MPHVVTQSCCADASCVLACPVNCIHPAPGEPDFGTTEMLYVDPRGCVGCGACVTACPVDAIKPAERLTPAETPFIDLNAAYYERYPHAERTPMAKVPGQRRLADTGRRVRAAVIGAGPAGMFTADELLKHPEVVGVDVFDRLPTPYGLARAGVAPDHGRTKQVERLFADIEQDPRLTYRLGVEVGRDISDEELSDHYDVVVYTVGASSDKTVGVPGEDLPGSSSATRLVAWYNGHPDATAPVGLDHERVVVVGHGNVALDVARILTAEPEDLVRTDIADEALLALRSSSVREVVLLGRRGPAQAAFTLPELIGLAALDSIDVVVEAPAEELTGDDPRSALLAELADRPARPGARRIVLRFLSVPVRYTGTEQVTGVDVARTRLVPGPDGQPVAETTQESEHLEAGLVLRSVGYRGVPVAGLPFDADRGTVPHEAGRVRPGRYVSGWIKRGPRGFIGTNRSCARETVETILDDLDAGAVTPPAAATPIDQLLRDRGVVAVDRTGWRRIDTAERDRGSVRGAPRSKITDVEQLVELARW